MPTPRARQATQAHLAEAEAIRSGLHELLKAWTRTRAASGGFTALAGFDYQISQALLEVIRSAMGGGELVLMEALSDIVQQDGGGLIVSQLKRTLSSGAVSKALEELWSIETLARTAANALRPKLQYRVQGSRAELKDVGGAILRWKPDGAFDPSELKEFLGRVQADVSAAPRLESVRLLIEHFADEDAQGTVDEFSGVLLRAGTVAAVEEAMARFRDKLASLKTTISRRDRDFRIWGTEDRAPSVVELEHDPRRAVRIGERLEIQDLIEGRLARRMVYDAIHLAAENWLAETAEAADKVPCFWIEGRSGAGKSAALLHLLAMLHDNDPERVVVWLGHRPERVGEALTRFRDLILGGRRLILALDDPLAPSRQGQFAEAVQRAGDEWVRLHSQGDDETLQTPVIVCCGPTEQYEFGVDNLYAELDFRAHALPRESPEDLAELATWFETRTGKRAPDLDGDVLLVQRFFEWSRGVIPDFSKRFKARLEGFDRPGQPITVFEIVARILAFGRLYADYPVAALESARASDDQLSRDLDQLADNDDHLSFQGDGEGVRLTHPHLADAIYREWFGRERDRPFRKRHLLDGLRAAVHRSGIDPEIRLAPLWAIARLVRSPIGGQGLPDDVRERTTLIRPELRELLPELYEEVQAGITPFSDLPVWVHLDRDLDLGLSPSPHDRLLVEIGRASQPARGLRLSCRAILDYDTLQMTDAPLSAVIDLLIRSASWRVEGLPWVEWSYIAVDAIRHGADQELLDPILQLIDDAPYWKGLRRCVLALQRQAPKSDAAAVTTAWLTATETRSRDWAPVLETALARGLSPRGLGDFGYRFLAANPGHGRWAPVWDLLHKSGLADRKRLESLALAWLGIEIGVVPAVPPETPGFDRVLAIAILGASDEAETPLIQLGLLWLDGASSDDPGWSYVWAALWQSDAPLPVVQNDLRTKGLVWLKNQTGHFGWSFVFHAITDHPRGADRSALDKLGFEWLSLAPQDHSGWPFVWETVLKSRTYEARSDDVIDIGEAWLRAAPEHPGWSAVWALIHSRAPRRRGTLLRLAREWLKTSSPRHPSWTQVAKTYLPVMRTEDLDPRLAASAFRWLRTRWDSPLWSTIFKASAKLLSPEQTDWLASEATVRLDRGGERYSPLIVKSVLAAGADEAETRRLLTELAAWLPDNTNHKNWSTGWRLVSRAVPPILELDALLALAADWSAAGGAISAGWPWFWPDWRRLLMEAGRATEVVQRSPASLAWLCRADVGHLRWFPIWKLLRVDARDLAAAPELVALERHWLRRADVRADNWSQVLAAHARKSRDWLSDAVIVDRLRREVAVGEERGWSNMLSAALYLPDAEREAAVQQGLNWLTNVESTQWVPVWKVVSKDVAPKSDVAKALVQAAEPWLARTSPSTAVWLMVLQNVLHLKPSRRLNAAEVEALVGFLSAAPASKEGISSWRLLAKATAPATRQIIDAQVLAKTLLALAPSDRSFVRLWSDFIAVSREADRTVEIGEIGLAWLTGPGKTSRVWPFIFRDLWKSWQPMRDRLRTTGHDWLKIDGRTAERADIVTARLFKSRGGKQ